MDDMVLLSRATRLDKEALTLIHQRYYDPIFRYIAFRVADGCVAEDLTSEVFVRLIAALRDRRAPQNTLKGWLYRVAGNVLADYYRKYDGRQEVSLDDSLPGIALALTDSFDLRLTLSELRSALRELTEDQQQVLALRFGQGLSVAETAHVMGKGEGAVKQLQARGLQALNKRLSLLKGGVR